MGIETTVDTAKQQILTAAQISRKINRMAVEIHEHNFDERELTIVGIVNEGYALSSLLVDALAKLAVRKITHVKLELDKAASVAPPVKLDQPIEALANAPLILVDDVLNTGRTLWYALQAFTTIQVPKIEVAVMVARNHSAFPIRPDFIGYGISTTLSNHVQVELSGNGEMAAYLI